MTSAAKTKSRKKSPVKRKQNTQSTPKKTKSKINLKFWHYIIPPTILATLTTVFYYQSLHYPFQFDDLANITKKFDIRFSNPLSTWLSNRRWMGEWLNRMNFNMGRFDSFPYRVTNLIVHIAAGMFLFFLILELCRYLKTKPFLSQNALAIASVTSALFLLHPVQTQAVSYAIQARLEGLATLFSLATLFIFVKAFQVKSKILKWILIPLSLIIGFFSCGTKEITIVLPFLALLIDWFFLSEGQWTNFKKRIWFHAVFALVIFGAYVNYLSTQFFKDTISLKSATHNNRGNVITQHAHDLIKPLQYLISEFKVILHYLFMYLLPIGLSVEYDWKMSPSFFSNDSFFPFLILLGLLTIALYVTIKKQKFSYIGFGLLWFFIAIAPRSTLIPSPELICDYKAYLASAGWLFLIAIGIVAIVNFAIARIKNLPKSFKSPVINFAVLSLLMIPIGFSAQIRNTVWSTTVTFWEDIVEKAPAKARGHNNLGVALSEKNRHSEAIPHYLEAIKLDRYYSDPYSNLAVAYSVNGYPDKAIAALKQAIRIFPHYPEAYNNLGTLMIKKKNYVAAEKILHTALRLRSYYGKAFFNLGRLYLETNQEEKAWESFKKATEGDLDTADGFLTLGQVSLKMKKYDEAVKALEKAVAMGGKSEDVYFNLANAYHMSQKHDKAQNLYLQLSKLKPGDPRYIYNYGETLYAQEKFDDALSIFGKAKSLPNTLPQSFIRYANCLEKLKRLDEAKVCFKEILNLNIPEQMKKMAENEIGRIAMQQKINAGEGTFKMSDLQKLFSNRPTDTTKTT